MKIVKLILSGIIIYSLFALFGTSFSSCTKQNTVYDTTTLIVKDTITLKDTITIKDTVIVTDTVMCNLTAGLVAYYNFNGGNLNDSSGFNNNIIFNNATMTSDRFGNPNNAYLFNGSSSYMQVANSVTLNPNNITMFAIIKVNGFNQSECHGNQIFGKGYPDDVNGYYAMRFLPENNGSGTTCAATVDTTKELFYASFGDNIPQGAATGASDTSYVQKSQWYTIAYTYDGTTSKFYVNGVLQNSMVNTSSVTFTPNSQDLFIGATGYFDVFPYYFNGAIDEIRIYNTAASAQQIGYLNILKTKYLRVGNKLIY